MPVYLPIAEMSVDAFLLMGVGMIIGFFSGLFGVGGGFLTTPFLLFLGVPASVAVSTQTCQIAASSTAGVISQWKRRAIDFKIGAHILAGGVFGMTLGLAVFAALRALGQIDLVISLLYTVLLGGIGTAMTIETFKSLFLRKQKSNANEGRIYMWLKTLPYQTYYPASDMTISLIGPVGIGFISAFLLAVLGTGAGFLMVPAMIYILRMPALMVTGTSLFQLLFLAAFAAISHAVVNATVDMMLAFLLISGSVVGTILGLRATRYIKGLVARLLLAVMILMLAIVMGYGLVAEPVTPYVVEASR